MKPMNGLPAEWHRQAVVLLIWPDPSGSYAPRLNSVEKEITELVVAISTHQPVIIVCQNDQEKRRITQKLASSSVELKSVTLVSKPFNDVWARDTMPLTTLSPDGEPTLQLFRFNGWGKKYPHDKDANLATEFVESGVFGACHFHQNDLTLEGGAVETDGEGTFLMTRNSVLNENRNPGLKRQQVEQQLEKALGAQKIVWIEHGHIEGDDTDSHIDTLARFCSPSTIAYSSCIDPNDVHYTPLNQLRIELGKLRTGEGNPYQLVPLPIPAPLLDEEGNRLPANYANFLIINEVVIIPAYGDPADEYARKQLENCFPERKVIPVSCLEIIRQFGSIHCLTMQIPAEVTINCFD